MSSYKESAHSRQSSQHRPLSGTNPVSVPGGRSSSSRSHSHSVSLGALNSTHRIGRRKSMTSNHLTTAAAAAAIQGMGMGTDDHSLVDGKVDPISKLHGGDPDTDSKRDVSSPQHHHHPPTTKQRNRRASDGGHLPKSEGRRVSGGGELRCDKCGKGYKHSSCLTKHLWEHTPEWSYTSKLLISKHQQVQLLEAASVLVAMNAVPSSSEDESATKSSANDAEMDMADAFVAAAAANKHPVVAESDNSNSSSSPAASGSSEVQDDPISLSSAETTPPPTSSGGGGGGGTDGVIINLRPRHNKRHSSASSIFSRSYGGESFYASASSVSTSAYGSYHGGGGGDLASASYMGGGLPFEDEAGLAAAVELCNFGTPHSRPLQQGVDDIPPVPPLPARYANKSSATVTVTAMTTTSGSHVSNNGSHDFNSGSNGSDGTTTEHGTATEPLRSLDMTTSAPMQRISDERADVKMVERPGAGARAGGAQDDDDERTRDRDDEDKYYFGPPSHHSRSDEYDDGVFGHMEE